jgi:hypothetical protein
LYLDVVEEVFSLWYELSRVAGCESEKHAQASQS